MSVQEGDVAPAFSLPASFGRTVSSAALKGKPYILYFYPKADTSGCTKEACAFQEALPQLGTLGLEVIGVSPDPIKPIEKFAAKYNLTFPLASDETKEAAGKAMRRSHFRDFLISHSKSVRAAFSQTRLQGADRAILTVAAFVRMRLLHATKPRAHT